MIASFDASAARRAELRRFLRAQRARISPAQAGLPAANRRRAVGLRREDVAELADISVSWYGRLEVGRVAHVSSQVLSAIARALQLDAVETAYLFTLAGIPQPSTAFWAEEPAIPGTIEGILSSFNGPAHLIDGCYNLISVNRYSRAILGYAGGENILRNVFLDDGVRGLFVEDWEYVARVFVAHLRLHYPAKLGDPRFEGLLAELRAESPEFARLWEGGELGPVFGKSVRVRLPDGIIAAFTLSVFPVPDGTGYTLVLIPPSDEPSARRVADFIASQPAK
jgi:transcriptional regulator with XRE-family HTH domain